MKTADEILRMINEYLDNLPYERRPRGLYDPIKYVLSIGGKRIRPTLMLLGYNLYKEDSERILPSAIALETYHNYTLLHDDLMDNADVRRGNPTVHKKWDANTAILSGDSMLVLAYQRMAECPVEKLKPEADAENLYKFGEQIGLAFQLQDDYLDVYGDPAVFGKAIGGDIMCNKKTYMLINAFNKATKEQQAELTRWVNAEDPDPKEKIAAVTDLYNKIGIRQLAEAKIQHYFDESRKYLAAVDVPEERKAELKAYTDKMMHREY